MTNYEWLMSMPEPVFAQWLCDINKCDSCWFKDKKDEYKAGKCTWQWLNEECAQEDQKQEEHHEEPR